MSKLEDYLAKHALRSAPKMAGKQLADLLKFADYADKGRVITSPGLVKYFKDEYGVEYSGYTLAKNLKKNGRKCWFAK